jgi:hypothetical protein
MLSSAKQVLVKYKSIVVKMIHDMNVMAITHTTFEYLCVIEVAMGLTFIMPLLKVMHMFIKFAQSKNNFMCDFDKFVKMCCAELYNMYVDPKKQYNQEGFKPFLDLHECTNDQLLIG